MSPARVGPWGIAAQEEVQSSGKGKCHGGLASRLPILDNFSLQLNLPSQCGGYGNDFTALCEQEMRSCILSKLSSVQHVA